MSPFTSVDVLILFVIAMESCQKLNYSFILTVFVALVTSNDSHFLLHLYSLEYFHIRIDHVMLSCIALLPLRHTSKVMPAYSTRRLDPSRVTPFIYWMSFKNSVLHNAFRTRRLMELGGLNWLGEGRNPRMNE